MSYLFFGCLGIIFGIFLLIVLYLFVVIYKGDLGREYKKFLLNVDFIWIYCDS